MVRSLRRLLWQVGGRLGPAVAADSSARLTVLVTFFDPVRMRLADALARNILRCRFVDRLVLSNHNPGARLDRFIHASDPRITVVEATQPQGCGYRWQVARRWTGEYLMVIDDDILLRPAQVRALFDALRAEPECPHGIAGLRRGAGGAFEFLEQTTQPVDYLCEVYAVSRTHLDEYARQRACLPPEARTLVDGGADFALISRSGTRQPQLHDVGRALRSESFKTPGVAVHQRPGFWDGVHQVLAALDGAAG